MNPSRIIPMEGVTVEPLRAAQVASLIPAHASAFEGSMHVALGEGYVAAMLRWYATAPDAIALVALRTDGRPVGSVFGTDDEGLRTASRALRLPAIRGIVMHPGLLARSDVRAGIWHRLRGRSRGSPSDPRLVHLVGISVAPSARRAGVGRALLAAFEREAARRGARELHLSVYPGNRAAIDLYLSAGWAPIDSSPGATGTVRYAKGVGAEVGGSH